MKSWPPILIAGLLTGCAHFESRPLAPEQSAAQIEARRLDAAGLKNFAAINSRGEPKPWPPQQWDLDSLTLAAFYFQPDLAVARAQWRVAEASGTTAGGRPNPTFTAGPGYNFNAASGVTPWLPFASLDVPLETAGKRGHRRAQAEHLAEAAHLNLATTAWQVRSNLRASLLDFVAAQHREQLLAAEVELQQQIVRSLEQRQQAGAIAGAELGGVRLTLARLQTDQADVQRLQVEARARVAEAIGVPLQALAGLELNFNLANTAGLDELTSAAARQQALQSRADILAALAAYAASQSALQLEIAKQYPDIHLNPGYQWDQGESKWQLGLTLELPLLNQNQGPIAEATARRAEAAARFEATQAKVMAELDRATAGLEASRKNLRATQALAAAQQTQRDSVAAQVKAGAADPLDLLTAELETKVAVLTELEAQVRWQQAIGALETARQRPADLPATLFEPAPQKEKETSP